jgi:D-3-phosphoglycerate dehydrogenase
MTLAEKLGKLATTLADGPIHRLELTVHGEKNPNNSRLLTIMTLQGLLSNASDDEPVNMVNATYIAERQAIEIVQGYTEEEGQFSGRTISLKIQASGGDESSLNLRSFEGTLINGEPRIVRINGYAVEVAPQGYLLISRHNDRPGIIGKVGTALGTHGVNIASMDVGRRERNGEAVMILTVDDKVPAEIIAELSKVDGVQNLRFVDLGN